MLFEVQNDNTLCNPLVCPLSDRAVGKYKNLEGGNSEPRPFEAEGFCYIPDKMGGGGQPSAPQVPTALSDISSQYKSARFNSSL